MQKPSSSEHFSFDPASDCAGHRKSGFKIRLANRYRNQTRVRICLGQPTHAPENLCLSPILVAQDPFEAARLSPSPGIATIEAENVQLPVYRADNFGFDFWLR